MYADHRLKLPKPHVLHTQVFFMGLQSLLKKREGNIKVNMVATSDRTMNGHKWSHVYATLL